MSKDDYQKYLKTDHWFHFTARIKRERDNQCEECGSTKYLQVHHLNYNNLWNESASDVRLLCYKCHVNEHAKKAKCKYCGRSICCDEAKSWRDIPSYCMGCIERELLSF